MACPYRAPCVSTDGDPSVARDRAKVAAITPQGGRRRANSRKTLMGAVVAGARVRTDSCHSRPLLPASLGPLWNSEPTALPSNEHANGYHSRFSVSDDKRVRPLRSGSRSLCEWHRRRLLAWRQSRRLGLPSKSPANGHKIESCRRLLGETFGRVDDRLRCDSAKKHPFAGLFRGDDRNRTGVDGFAGRCVATPPRRPRPCQDTGPCSLRRC